MGRAGSAPYGVPDLRGAHAVVTGAASGIGLATSRLLAARGAHVSMLDRNGELLDAAAGELARRSASDGVQVRAVVVDVADAAAVRSAVDALASEVGPCDVLVACAGLSHPGYFERMDDSVFTELMSVNYFGTLNAVRAVLPAMMSRRRGSLVAVSSVVGLVGVYGYSAYAPTKFAVRGLMETLRSELKPYGIHCACVYPADTDTPMFREENRIKPAETARISATIRPLAAETVAAAIVAAVERRRFTVTADPLSAMLARTAGLVSPALNRAWDRTIRRMRRSDSPAAMPVTTITTTLAVAASPPAGEVPIGARERRVVAVVLVGGAALVAAYWSIWFFGDRSILANSTRQAYVEFENAFPLADAWMATCMLAAALQLMRRRPSALFFGLVAGGAGGFLACMDGLYDVQHRIWSEAGAASAAIELGIVALTASVDVGLLRWIWRRRVTLLEGR